MGQTDYAYSMFDDACALYITCLHKMCNKFH